MPTPTTPTALVSSPLRALGDFIGRMAGARLRHGDCGGHLEVEVLRQHTAELHDEVEACATEAAQVEQAEQGLGEYLRAALTDKRSPGVIDAAESRGLRRRLANLHAQAHHHTTHLRQLAGTQPHS